MNALLRFAFVGLLLAAALPAAAQVTETPVQPVADATAPTIAQVLEQDGRFTTLLDALNHTGLLETLGQDGTYTLFAPTDDAFAQLPDGALTSLDADGLAALLRRHVALDAVTAEQASAMGEVPTASGDVLPVTATDDGAEVGPATVVTADLQASNGVVHVIDAVLMPAAETTADESDM